MPWVNGPTQRQRLWFGIPVSQPNRDNQDNQEIVAEHDTRTLLPLDEQPANDPTQMVLTVVTKQPRDIRTK